MTTLTLLPSLLIVILSNNSNVVFEYCNFKSINFGATGLFASQGDLADLSFEFKYSSLSLSSQSPSASGKIFAFSSANMQIIIKDSMFELNEICK